MRLRHTTHAVHSPAPVAKPPAAVLGRRAVLAAASGAAALAAVPSRAEIVNLVVIGKNGWLFPIWDEVRFADLTRMTPVLSAMGSAVELLGCSGVQVAFALTPAKSRIYKDLLPADFSFSAPAATRYIVGLEKLRAIRGALAVDMVPALMAARAASVDPVFFKGDTHWTGGGSQVAAVAFARQLQTMIKLPPTDRPGMALDAPVIVEWTPDDLAALLPAAQRGQYPVESYRVRQPAKASAASLLEDDSADVVVIGNSFMQPRLGFADMLSNQLARPVSLTWKVHQYGPYETLLSFLEGEAFKRKKPALLVWNFHETDLVGAPDRKDYWGQNAMAPQAFLSRMRQALGAA